MANKVIAKADVLCEWPIKFLQDKLYGITTGDLVVIGCDSGTGKSTISRLITRQAISENCPVVLYSLENTQGTFTTEDIMLRYSKDTGDWMNLRQFQIAYTKDPDKYCSYLRDSTLESFKEYEPGKQLCIIHERVVKGDCAVKSLIADMQKEIQQGYRLFVIDHLDVLGNTDDELKSTKDAMNELWALVDENNICVITFSQIVKGCQALCPCFDDLRGSKSKVYKSTIIITLGRHEYDYYSIPVANAKPTYVWLTKSRSTPTACAVCFYKNGFYLDTYKPVLCDKMGTTIDGMTREKFRKEKNKNDDWDKYRQ